MRTGLDDALVHFGLWRDDGVLVRADFAFRAGAVVGCVFGMVTRADREELRLRDAVTGMEVRVRLSDACDFWFRDTRDHRELVTTYSDGLTILLEPYEDPATADRVTLIVIR